MNINSELTVAKERNVGCIISVINITTIKLCWKIKKKYAYSYWDSLIIASALESNCSIIYTEDMQDGQILENRLKITNPFKTKKP